MHRWFSLTHALPSSRYVRAGVWLLLFALILPPAATPAAGHVAARPPWLQAAVQPASFAAASPCDQADRLEGEVGVRGSSTLVQLQASAAAPESSTETLAVTEPFARAVTGDFAVTDLATANAAGITNKLAFHANNSHLYEVAVANGLPSSSGTVTRFSFTSTLRSELAAAPLSAAADVTGTHRFNGAASSSGLFSYTFALPDSGTDVTFSWSLTAGSDNTLPEAGGANGRRLEMELFRVNDSGLYSIHKFLSTQGGLRLRPTAGRYLLRFHAALDQQLNADLSPAASAFSNVASSRVVLTVEHKPCTSALEVLDPNPLLLVGGELETDGAKLATLGRRVGGAAADGVTQLLLRQKVGADDPVLICISDEANQQGGLSLLGANQRERCVAPEAQKIDPYGYFAFAVYHVPEGLAGGPANTSPYASLTFRSVPNTPLDKSPGYTATLQLRRPPVVLVHDAWSGPGDWLGNVLLDDPRFDVTIADYAATRRASLLANRDVLQPYIRQALARFRRQGFAATQVDVVAHGEGGLLARLLGAGPTYKRNDNFRRGDIHKLLTLNTPHEGSYWLQGIRERRGQFPLSPYFDAAAARVLAAALADEVVDDLALQSDLWAHLTPTDIPVHAFVGAGGPELLQAPGDVGMLRQVGPLPSLLMLALHPGFDPSAAWAAKAYSEPNDLAVLQQSAGGSLPSEAQTVASGLESSYSHATGSTSAFSAALVNLLQTPVTSTVFARMTSFVPAAQPPAAILEAEPQATGGITITLATGDPIGGELTAVVDTDLSLAIQEVYVVGPGIVGVGVGDQNVSGRYYAELDLPPTQSGPIELTAYALNGAETPVTATLAVDIGPLGLPASLAVLPAHNLLTVVGQRQPLHVVGDYGGGITVDLGEAKQSIRYRSNDPTIVEVSEDGVVTALRNGVATVTASTNGGYSASAVVEVATHTNQAPIARNDAYSAESGEGQLLSVTDNDTDQDGDILNVAEVMAPANGETGIARNSVVYTSTPGFLGTEVFTYTVADGQGGTASATVVVTVTAPFTATSFSYMPAVTR